MAFVSHLQALKCDGNPAVLPVLGCGQKAIGCPSEEVQDSSWQLSWALAPVKDLKLTLTLQHKPPSLPWKHVEPLRIWCMREKPWVLQHFSPSQALLWFWLHFCFIQLKVPQLLCYTVTKTAERRIIPPHPKNEINTSHGNPVHNHGAYLWDICLSFTFSSHRKTQQVRSWLKSTDASWILRQANSRNSVLI